MELDKQELENHTFKHITKLIPSKIRDHNKTYDYLKWNTELNRTPATADSVLKFIFGLKDNQEKELSYFRLKFQSFMRKYLQSISNDQILLQKFFRFYMSLPVFEYGFQSKQDQSMEDLPPYQGSEQSNTFMLSMCNFDFKQNHKQIDDKELRKTMTEVYTSGIIDDATLEELIPSIIKYAKVDIELEQQYIYHSEVALLTPLQKFLEQSLNKSCEISNERLELKRRRLSEKNTPLKKVDLALYVPESCTDLYSCIEFKQFPINPKFYGPNGLFGPVDLFKDYIEGERGLESLALHKFLRHTICGMLSHKCNRGILTDSYTFIFLEIDLEGSITLMNKYTRERASFQVPREVPVNYAVKNLHTSKVTLRQTLLDFFNKSIVDGTRLKEIQEQMTNLTECYRLSDEEFTKRMDAKRSKPISLSKLSQTHGPDIEGSTGHRNFDNASVAPSKISDQENNGSLEISKSKKVIKTKSIIVPQDKFDILKHGYDRYSQVYSIEVSFLLEFLKSEDKNTDKVVIKIHDPWYYPSDDFLQYGELYKKELTESELLRKKYLACEENYTFERICYKILERDPKFNSIAYDHDDLKLSFCCQGGFFRKGMTNIFRFIETHELPKDPATYEKALEQLEIIHKNGIIHNDISERNILYSKDGKVYIIDYSFSFFSTNNDRVENDKNNLKDIFL